MFIRYSSSAKDVIAYSKECAKKLGHNYCGMEHILLGLVNINTGGLSSKALNNIGVTEEKVLKGIETLIGINPFNEKLLGFTPRVKIVLKLGYKECRKMKRKKVEPVHILLGLMKEGESVAIKILMDLSVDPHVLFNEIINLLDENCITENS